MDDEQENLFLHAASKSRWLITTSVASIAGALVIGTALVGTFGLGGIEGPSIASQHSASLWQQPASRRKGDRGSGLNGVVGRTHIAEVIAERSYKKISVAFDSSKRNKDKSKDNGKGKALPIIPTEGLIGSLAPDYPIRPSAINSQPSTNLKNATALGGETPTKPIVLKDRSTTVKLAALNPTYQNTTTIEKTAPLSHTEQLEETILVEKGDTLIQLLTERGTPKRKSGEIIGAMRKVFSDRHLQEGHKVHITYDNVVDKKGYETLRPIRIAIVRPAKEDVAVVLSKTGKYRAEDGSKTAKHNDKTNNADRFRARARIRKSLYFAAKEQGIPERVIVEMMRVHAYDVDFQRQVRPGDSFEVFYGLPNRSEGRRKRNTVLFSSLTLNKATRGYYRFTTPDDGITDYYDAKGRSATKFLMRTPVTSARITSGFGMRRHPILGYGKMHTGVDFAAPHGTPVKAAGHGVIEKIGRFGAYGKYIRIRHANGYKTAYAHMSRYASGLKENMKIQQDQVIGYIGSTGRSTGSHLHYEIIVNNRHVNPMKLRMPTGRRLVGKVRQAFMKEKQRIDQLMKAAPVSTQVASARN